MKVGLWLVGARGSVATTAIVGAAVLRDGLAPPIGCVTETPAFHGRGLPGLGQLVFGGHDLATTPLVKRAEELTRAGVIPAPLAELVRPALDAADAEIRPGVTGEGRQSAAIQSLVRDLTDFRQRRGLERVVVVNVSSTEPPITPGRAHQDLAALDRALDRAPDRALDRALDAGAPVLAPSSLYAYAAFTAGCPYVDFTPSTGARLPALDELARRRGVPYAGSDAKTGETLVKTALAPLFADRALAVRSWSGTNLLGGGDGATLADPAAGESKRLSKDRALAEILGHPVEGRTHIDNVPHLGDWKTAWDHITFEGFLGVRMSLQFTWQGCDSALAAPLVLDLARLMTLAHRRGVGGPVPELGFFFKDPAGSTEHRLQTQYETLLRWVGEGS